MRLTKKDFQGNKMAYYVRHKDLKKDRQAPDLSDISTFCEEVIEKDKQAEKIRKQKEEKNESV